MSSTPVRPATTGVDRDFAVDFAARWLAAWNSHQPDQLLALMTEDIEYDDSAWPRHMRGHADVREFLESVWRAMPDMEFEPADGPFLMDGQPKATLYWRGAGTFTGPLDPPGLAPTGARLTFDGFDLHEYRDGRVCRLRITFDMLDVSRQIGMSPMPGSLLEKVAAAAQRLVMSVKGRLGK